MGFPSSGCESLYRNSVADISRFFRVKHENNVKIFNLCLEKERIYSKNLFPENKVGLFPSKDHNPCPIKLILDFCVDISLYLINNKTGIAAVHCKAGKGRTGVMICCYLIFSGLCPDSKIAMSHYAKIRSLSGKGVTIASQKRYIQYFEDFLTTNFTAPYINMIPKIIKYNISIKTTNIVKNFMEDPSYYISPNEFSLNYIKIGPFPSPKNLRVSFNDFTNKTIEYDFLNCKVEKEAEDEYYYLVDFIKVTPTNCDVKIVVKGIGVSFFLWINFWYSTWNIIKIFMMRSVSKNLLCKAWTQRDENNKACSYSKGAEIVNEVKHNKRDNKSENTSSYGLIEMKQSKNFNSALEEENSKWSSPKQSKSLQPNVSPSHSKNDERGSILNEEKEIKNKSSFEENEQNLINIIEQLNHNSDLNEIILKINQVMLKSGNKLLDKDTLVIRLNADELDKFENKKKMNGNFSVSICYKLLEQKYVEELGEHNNS